MKRATLIDLWEELQKGAITEAALHDPAMHLDGFCDYGSMRVYVNQQPSTIETLLHELIHRRYRDWSETRVDAEAKRLLRTMDHQTIGKWYRKYKALARPRKTPRRIEG